MQDKLRTKAQLIEELQELRRRIHEAEQHRAVSREDRINLAIVDRAPFSVWACNRDFEIVLWNAYAEVLYGLSKKEAMGRSYLETFVDPPEREQSRVDCLRVIDQDNMQKNFLAYDRVTGGTHRTVLTNVFRVWDEDDGEFLQAEVGLDISDLSLRHDEHETLRELGRKRLIVRALVSSSIFGEMGLEQLFREIVANVREIVGGEVTSVVFLRDAQDATWSGKVSSVNDSRFQELRDKLGQWVISHDRPLFIDGHNRIPDEVIEYVDWDLADCASAVALLPLESVGQAVGLWIIRLQERYFSERVQTILKDFSEQIAFGVSIARLISDLKRMTKLAAERQDLATRSLIAVDFVHRMNNLAGPILNWTALIREELGPRNPSNQRISEYLDEIESEARDLLSAAQRLEEGPEIQLIDVNFVLGTLMRNARIQYRDVKIETDLDDTLKPVKAIYSQFTSAIGNVVTNGLEAMPDGGVLRLESKGFVEGGKPFVRIIARDTGPGMSEEQQEHIFDLNYSTKGPGRGYGLWRSKHVIEDMGGSVAFESEIGKGTTFYIDVPAVSSMG
ncbi:MAG: PAS domain-containing sensor histidine kinase [Chloroflexi bacterium]|nr:PAS domain-containing sensor histidine kinase [Chloroflexota bacterium]